MGDRSARRAVIALLAALVFARAARALGEAGTATSPGVLELAAPIEKWEEGLPLGNGLLGGLLWGSGNVARLSLDRGDLWDLRTPEAFKREDWNGSTIQRLVAAGDQGKIAELFDVPYDTIPFPTRLPAGRLEFRFEEGKQPMRFALDRARAEATVPYGDGRTRVRAFADSLAPVLLIRFDGKRPDVSLVPPAAVRTLGYPAARQDSFGGAVGSPGDLDGDLVPDVLVGAGRYANLGEGYARAFSGSSGAPLFTVRGCSTQGQFGVAVAGAGDANGDGTPDLVVGNDVDDPSGTDSGSAWIDSGRCLGSFTTYGSGVAASCRRSAAPAARR